YAAGFDADAVPVIELRKLVDDAAAIEKMAATVKALAAVRYADSETWRRDGDRSAAHHLARITGVGVGAAIDTLETARRLEDLPVAAAAALAGGLSPAQATAIGEAATADRSAEQRLVDKAGRVTLQELKHECQRTKAAADGDAEARRERIRPERSVRT